MAKKTLNSKVEHCPSCGILKSKGKQCKHCGYGATTKAEEHCNSINLKLSGYDMNNYNCVVINGVEFHR